MSVLHAITQEQTFFHNKKADLVESSLTKKVLTT